jgi:hypothetical protein
MDSDKVTVGDLNSDLRGTAARKSEGKPQWWQLPLGAVANLQREYSPLSSSSVELAIADLGTWQSGADLGLYAAMATVLDLLATEQNIDRLKNYIPLRALESTVAVLEFGAKKYPAAQHDIIDPKTGRPTPLAAGNWAKGMPWSVCLSCAVSHLFAAAGGEKLDKESGLSHLAHAMCNLLFLAHYEVAYPEGDDRIKQFRVIRRDERFVAGWDVPEQLRHLVDDRGVEPRGLCIIGDYA